MHPDITRGIEVFAQAADPELVSQVQALIDTDQGRWILDPHVERVIAFYADGGPRVVVWIDEDDFEHDTRYFG